MDQKLENQLNLALDATEEERSRSVNLDVGYNAIEREWELLIRYSGELAQVRELATSVTELLNGYAVVVLPQRSIELLSALPEIEYIEKPKRLYFEGANATRVSCVGEVRQAPYSLRGRGVLVGIVDSGIDYFSEAFRYVDGRTRILALWDQSLSGNPPEGYAMGNEYTQGDINEILVQAGDKKWERQRAQADTSGHGTAVAAIAAGSWESNEGKQYEGVAPESELLVVKMGQPKENGFPRTTELMQGVDYIVRKALSYRRPVAVNISFGNTYSSHDGNSLLERFLDDIADTWKCVICVGSGNEGTAAGHAGGNLTVGETQRIQLGVQAKEPTISIQIWKAYTDEVDIALKNPSGAQVGPFAQALGAQRFVLGQTEVLLYYGEPSPYSVQQEIYIELLPTGDYIDSGVWQIILTPKKLVSGKYELWLPSQSALQQGTAFVEPDSRTTLTIPSTAARVITVGAYDPLTFTYANFSGRGPLAGGTETFLTKPDLVAPGVQMRTVAAGGGETTVTGTSFATPMVTGSAALLMEWGIVKGNDPYLYGEKVKAYLQKGARQLSGFAGYPNPQVGYGALCIKTSLPE